jgi:hypothetical protein
VGAAFDTLGHLHLAARLVSGKAVGTDADTSNVVGAMVGPLSSSGRMEAVTLTLPSALSAIDFAWSSLRSHMHAPPSAAIRQAEEIVISCAEGENVPAIIDGEKVDVGNNFRIKFVERGASCLIG